MVDSDVVMRLSTQSAAIFCNFVIKVAKGLVEACCDDHVVGIAKKLVARGDLQQECQVIVALVVVEPNNNTTPVSLLQVTMQKDVALWVSDERPPRGRHDNDHLNYCNICTVPTVKELSCNVRSWLPLLQEEITSATTWSVESLAITFDCFETMQFRQ
jgi:hypothetical protein